MPQPVQSVTDRLALRIKNRGFYRHVNTRFHKETSYFSVESDAENICLWKCSAESQSSAINDKKRDAPPHQHRTTRGSSSLRFAFSHRRVRATRHLWQQTAPGSLSMPA